MNISSKGFAVPMVAAAAALVAVLCLGSGGIAPARAETLRVGKVVAQNFGFVPLNVGVAQGYFKKQGLDIDEIDFGGGAKQQQAVAAGSVDIAIGGGTDMAFIAKGVPELAVAAITTSPAFMGYIVGADSTVHSADDLKGKKIGVTTAGSLTRWLVDELNRVKGWGSGGAVPIAIGGQLSTELAALKTHEIDAFIDAPAIGYELETKKDGRLLFPVSDYVHDFDTFVIYATDPLVKKNPDAIRRFLKAWFESVAFMKTHKAETVAITRKITGFSQEVEEREYDLLMAQFSSDGKFDQKGLSKLRSSFTDLKILPSPPDMTKLYTEAYLPKM
ncbi:MAG TPA: ABC transporter substrate-binding protein [Stellaceae bacterium]|nr:ABC transporter substrate-binding protein [Stellaceae bacterium]